MAADVINAEWPGLVRDVNAALDDTQNKLLKKLDTIPDELSSALRALDLSEHQFRVFIKSQQDHLRYAIGVYRKELDKSLRNIKQAATRNSLNGYFAQAMGPAYEKAKLIKGQNSKFKIIWTLENKVEAAGSASPFAETAKKAVDTISKDIIPATEKLLEMCDAVIGDIYTFSSSLVGDGDENEAVTPIKVALQKHLPGVIAEFENILADMERLRDRT